jgi:hypothetical protein
MKKNLCNLISSFSLVPTGLGLFALLGSIIYYAATEPNKKISYADALRNRIEMQQNLGYSDEEVKSFRMQREQILANQLPQHESEQHKHAQKHVPFIFGSTLVMIAGFASHLYFEYNKQKSKF